MPIDFCKALFEHFQNKRKKRPCDLHHWSTIALEVWPRTSDHAHTSKLKNVLLTTDFSTGSLAALPYASRIARAFGANLHLCHIEPTAPLATGLADLHLYETAGNP
jgi:hypothetical protein